MGCSWEIILEGVVLGLDDMGWNAALIFCANKPAEHLVGFEPGTFRFLLQRLNPLGHSVSYYLNKVRIIYLS